jgi:hypothetical protein
VKEYDPVKAVDELYLVTKMQDMCMATRSQISNSGSEVYSSFLVSHQNIILYDININEFLVSAYRYI